jgi:GTPase
MKNIHGNTGGLKANQVHRLENLYRRRIPPHQIITPELARDLSRLSAEIHRQIGVLINRVGKIAFVIVGDHQQIVIPDTREYRVAPGRLRGLRCIHTHLNREPLTQDDLTDLALLRLDLMAAITVDGDGVPHQVHVGHILPTITDGKPYQVLDPLLPSRTDIDCSNFIKALEEELAQRGKISQKAGAAERAMLISVSTGPRHEAMDSLDELKELARTSGIHVIDTAMQQRSRIHPRFVIGSGKLKELAILALHKGVSLIIFDQELNPSQIRAITDLLDLKVIDRTQLILDIFAQRAQTREGKLQVELAQLKYLLPRLVAKNTAMSRLTGGIGGRGPGETKLEINRRRVRERIERLQKELLQVRKHRRQQRSRRSKHNLPIISIVGYTNAGKSTLLNTLTRSKVLAESRLFATLDPSSRRLRFPQDFEVIITDTVGFIKNLPQDLLVAFRATLEELENADLLLHVIDISNPRFEDQVASVDRLLADLDLNRTPVIRVLNKQDLAEPQTTATLRRTLKGIPASANDRATLIPLINEMAAVIQRRQFQPITDWSMDG